jgi:hypothetical protein
MAVQPLRIALVCRKNNDGTFSAYANEHNGGRVVQIDASKFSVHKGDCAAIEALYDLLGGSYPGVPIEVSEVCADCIPVMKRAAPIT